MASALREAALLAAAAAILSGCPAKKACPEGKSDCGLGICADLATDPSHCGACWTACGAGTCAGGVCQCEGLTRCDALVPRCRDLATDAASCGSCGYSCPLANAECALGACQCPAALPTECPTSNPTACVNLASDPRNCSACGNVCPLRNAICSGGACQCPASLPDACPLTSPTACVNLGTDAANCGACGNPCPAGETCCSGVCKDLLSDAANCGTCGHACAQATCCSGSCKTLGSDPQNCGACGRTCPAGAACVTTACVCPASAPNTCGSSCCAGSRCCGTGSDQCQPAHSNGLGGSYYLGCTTFAPSETTYDAALAAADSWRAGTTLVGVDSLGCANCLARRVTTSIPNQCAVWCWGGSLFPGKVELSDSAACVCPTALSGGWN